jgi:hypothetical protein
MCSTEIVFESNPGERNVAVPSFGGFLEMTGFVDDGIRFGDGLALGVGLVSQLCVFY